MDLIVADRRQAWQIDDQAEIRTKPFRGFDVVDELAAVLAGDQPTRVISVAGGASTVAGTGIAVGNMKTKNIAVSGGYLEADLSMPNLFGVSATMQKDDAAPGAMIIENRKGLSWLAIVFIVLVVIIFLNGLLQEDSAGKAN